HLYLARFDPYAKASDKLEYPDVLAHVDRYHQQSVLEHILKSRNPDKRGIAGSTVGIGIYQDPCRTAILGEEKRMRRVNSTMIGVRATNKYLRSKCCHCTTSGLWAAT